MAYLDLIRPKNLLIVAFTQLFFQYIIIVPVFNSLGIDLALSQRNLALLILCTVLIAAGGNIINDFYDREIDKKNNRRTRSLLLSSNAILRFYILIVILGGMIAFYVARDIDNLKLFLIYPLAVLLLFLYSFKLKHLPLIGNIVVSSFTALVIFILLFAERVNVSSIWNSKSSEAEVLMYCSGAFMFFAFISNVVREIIKDIEDIEGDKQCGSKTAPIVWGIKWSKAISIILLMILLFFLIAWPPEFLENSWPLANIIYLRLILTIPVLYFLWAIYRANKKQDFNKLSQLLKIYMIGGLLYLPFYYIS